MAESHSACPESIRVLLTSTLVRSQFVNSSAGKVETVGFLGLTDQLA